MGRNRIGSKRPEGSVIKSWGDYSGLSVESTRMDSIADFKEEPEGLREQCCSDAPMSAMGRRLQMGRMIFILFIPITGIIIYAGTDTTSALNDKTDVQDIKLRIEKAHDIGGLVHALQLERAAVVLFLAKSDFSFISIVVRAFSDTDSLIGRLDKWPLQEADESLKSREAMMAHLDYERDLVLQSDVSLYNAITFYNNANDEMLKELKRISSNIELESVWQLLLAYRTLVQAKESYGVASSFILEFYYNRMLKPVEMNSFIGEDALAEDHLKSTFNAVPELQDIFESKPKADSSMLIYEAAKESVMYNIATNYSVNDAEGDFFYDNMTILIKLLQETRDETELQIMTRLDWTLSSASAKVVSSAILMTVVTLAGLFLVITVHRMTSSIQEFAKESRDKAQLIHVEKQRSDNLLCQMLPKSVARALLNNQQVEAELYDECTVYFSDIIGFTSITTKATPIQIVDFLNALYNLFDNFIDKYDVYKVETIGDSYIVVSGIPKRNGSHHVNNIADLALDLLSSAEVFKVPHDLADRLELRIGLNSGPCVAGVVGSKMPRYCLFGDTMNTASRMETNGLPFKIHVSDNTKKLLDAAGGYITECRGLMEIKGKGKMNTYWLTGKAKKT